MLKVVKGIAPRKIAYNDVKRLCGGRQLPSGKGVLCSPISSAVAVYVYTFKTAKGCSKIKDYPAGLIVQQESIPIEIKQNIDFKPGASFFSTDNFVICDVSESSFGITCPTSVIPEETESLRCQKLFAAFTQTQKLIDSYTVQLYSAPGFTKHYSQFTGGGDILIFPKDSSSSAIVVSAPEEPADRSPIRGETSGVVIEAKNSTGDLGKFNIQLAANCICLMGNIITNTINEGKADKLVKCNCLTVYGVLLGVTGTFGCIKVTMDFKMNRTTMKIKSPIQTYHSLYTIVLFDSAINYLLRQLNSKTTEDNNM